MCEFPSQAKEKWLLALTQALEDGGWMDLPDNKFMLVTGIKTAVCQNEYSPHKASSLWPGQKGRVIHECDSGCCPCGGNQGDCLCLQGQKRMSPGLMAVRPTDYHHPGSFAGRENDTQHFYADPGLQKMCVYRSAAQPHQTVPCWQGAAGLAALQGTGARSRGWLWQVGAAASPPRSQVWWQPRVSITDTLGLQCS